jgi:hypothetical protein
MSIVPFFTTMKVNDNKDGVQIYIAPANHNRLLEPYTLKIVSTLLGNAYQNENNPTVHNQDLGIDACVIVEYGANDFNNQKKIVWK